MSKNIEMNYFNGSSYEELYPQTNLSNILDWNGQIYSKLEIDSKISPINDSIAFLQENLSPIKFVSIVTESPFSLTKNQYVNLASNVDITNTIGLVFSLNITAIGEGFERDFPTLRLGPASYNFPWTLISRGYYDYFRGNTYKGTILFYGYNSTDNSYGTYYVNVNTGIGNIRVFESSDTSAVDNRKIPLYLQYYFNDDADPETASGSISLWTIDTTNT